MVAIRSDAEPLELARWVNSPRSPNRRLVFEAISREPGANFSMLAKMIAKPLSRVSEIINHPVFRGLVDETRDHRQKRVELSSLGKQVATHLNASGKGPQLERPIHILVVEDSPGYSELLIGVLNQASLLNRTHVVETGGEALEFLFREGTHRSAPRPDLIILDLGLPDISGLDVLERAKTEPDLRSVPVIVLTASEEQTDVARAYELQASCFIRKPVNLENLIEAVAKMEAFWLGVVQLPPA